MRNFQLAPAIVLRSVLLSMGFVCFSSWAAEFSEQITEVGQTLATEVILEEAEPRGAVLMIHGWAGQMDEVGDMYKRLAAELAAENIASLRINIRGESEREATNYRLTSTFASRIQDAKAGLEYLLTTYPETKIGLLGFSLGGATALELVGQSPEAIDSLLLWSTVGNPNLMFTDFTEAQKESLMQQGEVTIPYWVDLTISQEHYLGFQGYDPFPALKNYRGALLSIRGTEDYVPAQEALIFAAASASPEKELIIEKADHIFNVLDPESVHDERLIEASKTWFSETLVQ